MTPELREIATAILRRAETEDWFTAAAYAREAIRQMDGLAPPGTPPADKLLFYAVDSLRLEARVAFYKKDYVTSKIATRLAQQLADKLDDLKKDDNQ